MTLFNKIDCISRTTLNTQKIFTSLAVDINSLFSSHLS